MKIKMHRYIWYLKKINVLFINGLCPFLKKYLIIAKAAFI